MKYGLYWIVLFVFGSQHMISTEVLDSSYLPWRTTIEDHNDKNDTATALCKLPEYPQNGSYVVYADPDGDVDAKPGDMYENVSLVQYIDSTDGRSIEIKALKCSRGMWSESILQYETNKIYFNTTWCPMLCSSSDVNYREPVQSPGTLTDIHKAIKDSMNAEKSCILPPYPAGGTYHVVDKPSARPGDAFVRVQIKQYTFDRDSGIYEGKDLVCSAGVWYMRHQKLEDDKIIFLKSACVTFCSSLIEKNESIEPSENQSNYNVSATEDDGNPKRCKLPPYPRDGNYTVVNQPKAAPGDVTDSVHLMYSCRPKRKLVGSENIYCIEGVWSDLAPSCIQCGLIKSFVAEEVTADEAVRRELPWHVAIYDRSNGFEHICSGSIVATNLIVTAAHCFWSDVGALQPASRFAVAAGKVFGDWNSTEDEHTQKRNVVQIIIHPRYGGSLGNFKNDLALVILDTALNFTDYVTSVCLNFDTELDEKQSRNVKIGKFGSWRSFGAIGQEVSKLRHDWTRYVELNKCVSEGASSFRRYVTRDKICAEGTEGPVLCKSDGGGSLSYHVWDDDGTRVNYLRGVASASSEVDGACSPYSVGVFTHILRHERFIKEHLKEAIWN